MAIRRKRTAWVLESATYLPYSRIVGVFQSRKAAERYKSEAVPPVEDGTVAEWQVSR